MLNPLTHFLNNHWRAAVLCVLPLLITLINPNWLYNPSVMNTIDTWIYHSLFRYLPDFATTSPVNEFYFIERLGLILPGYFLYHVFPPEIANFLLRLGVYYLTVFSLYGVASYLFTRDSAFIMAMCLGGYTWFLRAAGHDYVDGIGIAYYSASLWFATLAASRLQYRRYLLVCGVFLTLTVTTQLTWALFIPLVGVYYIGLNFKNNRHPIITSIIWVSMGILISLSVLMLFNWLSFGEWNIFKNSIAVTRVMSQLSDSMREVVINGYARFPMTWMVLPCVLAVIYIYLLLALKKFPAHVNCWNFQLVLGIFVLTLGAFTFMHFFTPLLYLFIYLYMSMVIPITFLSLSGIVALAGTAMAFPRYSFVYVVIAVLPLVLMIIIPPLEGILLNGWVSWLGTAFTILVCGYAVIKKHPTIVIGSFSLFSLILGSGNGIAYHDRLMSYRVFVGINDTIQAIENHIPDFDNYTKVTVWYETTNYLPYAKPFKSIYWLGTSWQYIQTNPYHEQLMSTPIRDIVMLSDSPDIVDRVRLALTDYFEMELISDFNIPSIDSSSVYRGYVLRLYRKTS